jgi:FkbM family methyltransferase
VINRSKALQSGLLRMPRVYDALAGPRRYQLMHKLGRAHEPEFPIIPGLLCTPAPVVLDVGGNIGQSILSFKTVLPASRIVTFEPNPANHPKLAVVTKRLPDVRIEKYGLGSEAGRHDLFIPIYNGRAMTGLASFERAEAEQWLNSVTVYGFNPELLTIRETEAEIRRLDDLDLEPDVIKIDVQGLEGAVITGGIATIARCRPVILAETVRADNPAMALLEPLGYRRYEVHDGKLVDARDQRANQLLICQ